MSLSVYTTGIIHSAAGVEHSPEWYGQQAVYRVSMGNFVRSPLSCSSAVKEALPGACRGALKPDTGLSSVVRLHGCRCSSG